MSRWATDALLPDHSTLTLPLIDEPTYGVEPAGSLVATLVRSGTPRHDRAVLYVHGWSDYYFQAHVARQFDAMGYDFYAVDLRRYGRSLRGGQLAGYVPALKQYDVELEWAVENIRAEGYSSLVLYGHSTGGLIASLFAAARPDTFDAVVLNAPWIEFQGSPLARPAAHPLMSAFAAVSPTTALPMSDNGYYLRTIRADEEGEWEFDTNLKGDPAFLVRVGWIRAVMSGQAQVERGLDIDCPVLVVTSARSHGSLIGGAWSEEFHRADGVLDVVRITERAPDLGSHVTIVRLDGALHDVSLSKPPIRARFFDEVRRFLATYAA